MKALLVARRDLASYMRSPAGYIIIAAVLLIDGLLFNVDALGGTAKKSAEVLERFFYFSSGTTMIAWLRPWLASLSRAMNIRARLLPDAGGDLISRYCSPRRS